MKKDIYSMKALIMMLLLVISSQLQGANLTINFVNMNPHSGKDFHLRIIDKSDGMEVFRTNLTGTPSYSVIFDNLIIGQNYTIDFYADLNQNGKYDPPSADHAWRLNLDNVMGDTTLTFTHNTSFTDISWPYLHNIHFVNMTPHLGQLIELRVVDKSDNMEIGRWKIASVQSADFTVSLPGLEWGGSYMIDFFADHNHNMKYDPPSADHAWRLNLDNVMGDTTLTFTHNTSFTDISWPYLHNIHFANMTPHLGQLIELRVVDKSDNMEIGRWKITSVQSADFTVSLPGLEQGGSYMIDFFADHNQNMKYDPPSADHAWRLNLDNVIGDTTLTFTHNTSFTDIAWNYLLTINFLNMTPHVGQMLNLKVYDESDNSMIGEYHLESIPSPDFHAALPGIMTGRSYRIDFYADHNNNGSYDMPPADHAWRMELINVVTDTALTFTHNTNFTDISIGTSRFNQRAGKGVNVYPNPTNGIFRIETPDGSGIRNIEVIDMTGRTVEKFNTGENSINLDYRGRSRGFYFLKMETEKEVIIEKLILR